MVITPEIVPRLIRALRGRRSQTALSRRLGYRSNVVYMWESGRREPSASELFRIIERTGGDAAFAFSRFRVDLSDVDLRTPEGIAALLSRLRGNARVVDVAERAGVSRFTASRWLRGSSEPRLRELLVLIEALTRRTLDVLACVVEPSALPGLSPHFEELDARRRVAFAHPWSQAVLRLLETEAYRRLPRHRPGFIAERLGIPRSLEESSLEALRDAGLVNLEGGLYRGEPMLVDTSMATWSDRQKLKAHWADVGRERLSAGSDGLFSWSVFALSKDDYAKLQELHVRYMRSLRQLVDASDPSEVVAVANVQLFALESPSGDPRVSVSSPRGER